MKASSLTEGRSPTKPLTKLRFKPSLLTTLAAAAGIAAGLALGNWQLGRAHEKEAIAARLGSLSREPVITLPVTEVNAKDVQWRRVTVRGRFEPRYAVFLDNRVHQGVPGYHVIMPLAMGGGRRYVLVNRGWIAGTGERARLPSVRTPVGPVEVSGIAVVPSHRFFELSSQVSEGRVWQNLTLDRYRKAVPIPLQPIVIQQQSPLDDGLIREWSPPDLGVNTHYAYAVQWFALAFAILVFYLFANVRRAS